MKENLQSVLALVDKKTRGGVHVGRWGLTHNLKFSKMCVCQSYLECSPVVFSTASHAQGYAACLPAHQALSPAREVCWLFLLGLSFDLWAFYPSFSDRGTQLYVGISGW